MTYLRNELGRIRDMNYFMERITQMNRTFEIGANYNLTFLGAARLFQLHTILAEELSELANLRDSRDSGTMTEEEVFVGLSDFLADMIVYCTSEARRWGISLVDVLHVVMDSQDSKLVDGKPIKAPATNKFMKGPNYVPPEKNIERMLFNKPFPIKGVIRVKKTRMGLDGTSEIQEEVRCSLCSTLLARRLVKSLEAGTQQPFNCIECKQLICTGE